MKNKEDFKKMMFKFGAAAKSFCGEIPESECGDFYEILSLLFYMYREKWCQESIELAEQYVDGNMRGDLSYKEMLVRSVRAVKAFQVLGSVIVLTKANLLPKERHDAFVWDLFKVIAEGEESHCRGYYSRYFRSNVFLDSFIHDVTKNLILGESQDLLKKDYKVRDKARELLAFSMDATANLLGVEASVLDEDLK